METLNMYQIPRSIMHDPLQNHVAHHFVTFSLDHFVTFSLDRLLLPIDMTEFTPLPSLYAQLPLHAQLYADSSTVRSIAVIARSVAATDRPHLAVYDRSDYLHCMIAPLPPLINPSVATMVRPSVATIDCSV